MAKCPQLNCTNFVDSIELDLVDDTIRMEASISNDFNCLERISHCDPQSLNLSRVPLLRTKTVSSDQLIIPAIIDQILVMLIIGTSMRRP